MHGFDVAALVLGLLLLAGAALAALGHRRFLSLTAVFVVAGFVLGHGVLGVLHFRADSAFVRELAVVALVVILFRDGIEVEGEMLRTAWHLPLRKLVVGMPLTAGIVAVAAHALTSLSWTESFLLGALLSPTDPVLSSSVVTNPRVPRLVRHSLNLESGLNDGLALPAVVALSAALDPAHGGFDVVSFVLRDVGLGFVYGVVLGLVGARLLPSGQRSLYALGLAFAVYGVAALGHGNGFIAVYVAAIAFGIRRPAASVWFAEGAEDIVEIVKLGIFVVFGSLLTFGGLLGDGWAAVAIVAVTLLVARPVAVFAALAGTRLDVATKGFMAWFGPKGVATMTFSLLILSEGIAAGDRIFNLAALCVVTSVLVHGLTDRSGAEWIAGRNQQRTIQRPRR